MAEPFLGEIRMFAGTFAPVEWALCNGQLLAIRTDTALFSLLGTAFGGNGTTTFGLPNLQSRVPIHWGQGSGLSDRFRGEEGGAVSVALTLDEMGAHTHRPPAFSGAGSQVAPTAGFFATSSTRDKQYAPGASTAAMMPAALDVAGGSQPHDNLPPFLVVTYIIALRGVFPQRP